MFVVAVASGLLVVTAGSFCSSQHETRGLWDDLICVSAMRELSRCWPGRIGGRAEVDSGGGVGGPCTWLGKSPLGLRACIGSVFGLPVLGIDEIWWPTSVSVSSSSSIQSPPSVSATSPSSAVVFVPRHLRPRTCRPLSLSTLIRSDPCLAVRTGLRRTSSDLLSLSRFS